MAVEKAVDSVVLLEGFVVGAVMFRRFESVVVNKPERKGKKHYKGIRDSKWRKA